MGYINNTIWFELLTMRSDGYAEYNIYYNNVVAGKLQTIEDDRDYIFIRQIFIAENMQRIGIGKAAIDNIVLCNTKKIRFTIATNSNKAVQFWNKYLNNTEFNSRHIKGGTYEL